MSGIDRVLDALRAHGCTVRGGGRNWEAQCPIHSTTANRSLSITRGETRTLLRCHGGPQCDSLDVLTTLGLTYADLFDEPLPERDDDGQWMPCRGDGCTAPKTNEYPYTDEHGTVLYSVVRCAAKHLRPWRPDRTAKYGRRWNLEGVRRVPYRLPQLMAAVAADRVVWIAEGEKDADALASRPGMTATTNAFGAGNWPAEFSSAYLRGADVDIMADRDPAGRKRAEQIVSTLRGVARSIRVLQARHGKDAADHFAAGGHTGNFITVWEPVPYTGAGVNA